jgi:hypothetical protein
MKQMVSALVALSVIATWMSLSTASPETCVVANFKNAKNACPAGMKLTVKKEAEEVEAEKVAVTPTSAPANAACVKTNIKNFKNRCPG